MINLTDNYNLKMQFPIVLPSNWSYKIIYDNNYDHAYDGETTKQYTETEVNNGVILGIGYSYNDNSINPEIVSSQGILEQILDSGLFSEVSNGDFYRIKGYKAKNINGATFTLSDNASTRRHIWIMLYEK